MNKHWTWCVAADCAECVWSVTGYFWGQNSNIGPINGDSLSNRGRKLFFRSVVKVTVRLSPQKMNLNLCNVSKSDHGVSMCVRVFVSVSLCKVFVLQGIV